jgi:hypothetical protein
VNIAGRAIEIDELRGWFDRNKPCRTHLVKEREAISVLNPAAREAYFAAEITKVADAIRGLSDNELFGIARQLRVKI